MALLSRLHGLSATSAGAGLLYDGLFLAFNTLEELMERVGELLHSLIQQLLGNLVVMDANFLEGCKLRLSLRDVVLYAQADLSVVAEVLDGLKRHGINGMGAYQFLGVEHIAICGIFGARAGPQRSLRLCPAVFER